MIGTMVDVSEARCEMRVGRTSGEAEESSSSRWRHQKAEMSSREKGDRHRGEIEREKRD